MLDTLTRIHDFVDYSMQLNEYTAECIGWTHCQVIIDNTCIHLAEKALLEDV